METTRDHHMPPSHPIANISVSNRLPSSSATVTSTIWSPAWGLRGASCTGVSWRTRSNLSTPSSPSSGSMWRAATQPSTRAPSDGGWMMVRRRGGASHEGQAWDSLLFLASRISVFLSLIHTHLKRQPRSPACGLLFACVFSPTIIDLMMSCPFLECFGRNHQVHIAIS